METLEFTRVPSDVNGNPRYAVHFTDLLRADEGFDSGLSVSQRYDIACKRANTIGGRKYHNKRYGGGIVFQSYSVDETARDISRVTGRHFIASEG